MDFVDFNECGSNPCQNGGTCTDHLNRYRCLCMQGYNGVNCQTGQLLLHYYKYRCIIQTRN